MTPARIKTQAACLAVRALTDSSIHYYFDEVQFRLFLFQAYPPSARRLNPTTKQLDVDVYDNEGNIVVIAGLQAKIELIIARQREKNPKEVDFQSE
jgi:uncharacterized protein YhbP (UPF0306 family)